MVDSFFGEEQNIKKMKFKMCAVRPSPCGHFFLADAAILLCFLEWWFQARTATRCSVMLGYQMSRCRRAAHGVLVREAVQGKEKKSPSMAH